MLPLSLIFRRKFLVGFLVALLAAAAGRAAADDLRAGFGEADITPAVDGKQPVWVAGYGMGRKATGVHDPIMARCVVLESGGEKLSLVSVDLVGLQYAETKRIRAGLADFRHVTVSSSHNHEGPDVIGIWGRGLLSRGVDEAYLDLVVERVVAMVKQAATSLAPVTAYYGTATDESLLGDSREPIAKDGVLRVLRLDKVAANADASAENSAGNTAPAGLIVQWNCHPESLGRRNTLLTADFPYYTVASLKQTFACPVVYLSGSVGGLMAPPQDGVVKDAQGQPLADGSYEYAQVYGELVADLACRAIRAAEPLRLTPFTVSAKPVAIPVRNVRYKLARATGVIQREANLWTGDFEKLGDRRTPSNGTGLTAMETEVGYLRLGELHIACIPGEIYPELVYGKFEEPADKGADFPESPLEPTIAEILPGKKWLLLGLANDEIGYIIPKRQWDYEPPFAYGLPDPQYGEINSCGFDVAPIIMEALQRRVRDAELPAAK
jgi:hypothetical protein